MPFGIVQIHFIRSLAIFELNVSNNSNVFKTVAIARGQNSQIPKVSTLRLRGR